MSDTKAAKPVSDAAVTSIYNGLVRSGVKHLVFDTLKELLEEAADTIEALGRKNERLAKIECDECERKEETISAMIKAAYAAKLGGNPFGSADSIIEAYKHAHDEGDQLQGGSDK